MSYMIWLFALAGVVCGIMALSSFLVLMLNSALPLSKEEIVCYKHDAQNQIVYSMLFAVTAWSLAFIFHVTSWDMGEVIDKIAVAVKWVGWRPQAISRAGLIIFLYQLIRSKNDGRRFWIDEPVPQSSLTRRVYCTRIKVDVTDQ